MRQPTHAGLTACASRSENPPSSSPETTRARTRTIEGWTDGRTGGRIRREKMKAKRNKTIGAGAKADSHAAGEARRTRRVGFLTSGIFLVWLRRVSFFFFKTGLAATN